MNGNQVDAIEQVFAEGMFLYHLAQVGIGGTDYPDIYFSRTAITQNFKGLFLQDPKQFHLATQIQVSDFVQENGSLIGQFKTSHSVR